MHGIASQLQPQVIMGAKYRLKHAVEENKKRRERLSQRSYNKP